MENLNTIPILRNYLKDNKSNKEIEDEDINQLPHLLEFYKNLDSQEIQNEFEKLLFNLEKMGYPQKIIFRSFLIYRYKDINEALEILSKTNEVWNHKFIEGFKNKCFICDNLINNHKKIENLFSNNLKYDKINSFPIENSKLFEALRKVKSTDFNNIDNKNNSFKINNDECPICILELEKNNEIILECKHKFCKDCILSYLEEEIKNSRVDKIKCPEKVCGEEKDDKIPFIFNDNLIKSLISNELFEKYKEYKEKNIIEKDKTFTFCPIPDCKGFAKIEVEFENKSKNIELEILNNEVEINEEDKFLKINDKDNIILNVSNETNLVFKLVCNKKHEFCSKCKSIWNKTHKCEKDAEFVKYSNENLDKLKKCPKCGTWIEKNRGCNHMTCFVCKYEFCWLCMGEYNPEHYNIVGTPCHNQMFPPEEVDPQLMNEIQELNENLFLFFFKLTFFVVRLIFSVYFNQNVNNIEQNPAAEVPRRNKFGFFTFMVFVLLCFYFLFIFSNGILLVCMIKSVSYLILLNQGPNVEIYNRIKPSFFYVFATFFILWFVLFLPGIMVSTIWLGIALLYVMWVAILY